MERKEYPIIDIAKIIAAVLVVSIHFPVFGKLTTVEIFKEVNFWTSNYLSRLAVPLFFISSGFLINSQCGVRIDSVKLYVKKLLKLYSIWAIIYAPLYFYSYLHDIKSLPVAILKFIWNFIFVGTFSHLWYMPALIFAIIFISYLMSKKVKYIKITVLSVVMYIIGLLGTSWFAPINYLSNHSEFIRGGVELYFKLFFTTRNGLFEGFMYVWIGVLLSNNKIRITKIKSLILFIISMFFMGLEILLLEKYNSILRYEMYAFLVPSSIFLFSFIMKIELLSIRTNKIRCLSTLIYFIHPAIGFIIERIVTPMGLDEYVFLFTTVMSILISTLIIKFAESGCNVLKILYK